jgi:MbtH protein
MQEENIIYKVMINQANQYSLWPANLEPPLGWNETGCTGTRHVCLSYIAQLWTELKAFGLEQQSEGNRH